MRNIKHVFILILVSTVIWSCGDGEIVDTNPNSIKAKDIIAINKYLAKKGYDTTKVDTTRFGVRYVIVKKGTGTEKVDGSDIISFNYVGKTLQDSVFDASIDSIAKKADVFDSTRVYSPSQITYSLNGWTTKGRFINGFSEGLATSFKGLAVGGHTLILMPSSLGYGARGAGKIKPNTPLAFDLYLTKIVKQ